MDSSRCSRLPKRMPLMIAAIPFLILLHYAGALFCRAFAFSWLYGAFHRPDLWWRFLIAAIFWSAADCATKRD